MRPQVYVSYTAALLSAIAFLPSAWHVYRRGKKPQMALATIVIFFLSQIFWLLDAYLDGDMGLSFASVMNICVYLFFIYSKLSYPA